MTIPSTKWVVPLFCILDKSGEDEDIGYSDRLTYINAAQCYQSRCVHVGHKCQNEPYHGYKQSRNMERTVHLHK